MNDCSHLQADIQKDLHYRVTDCIKPLDPYIHVVVVVAKRVQSQRGGHIAPL